MLCFLPHKYAIYEYPQPFAPTPLDQPTKITCISWDPARNAVAIYSNPIFTAYYVYEPFNNGLLGGTMASIFFPLMMMVLDEGKGQGASRLLDIINPMSDVMWSWKDW